MRSNPINPHRLFGLAFAGTNVMIQGDSFSISLSFYLAYRLLAGENRYPNKCSELRDPKRSIYRFIALCDSFTRVAQASLLQIRPSQRYIGLIWQMEQINKSPNESTTQLTHNTALIARYSQKRQFFDRSFLLLRAVCKWTWKDDPNHLNGGSLD